MTLDMTHPSVADLKRRAKRRVPKFVWEYLDSGTGDDTARDRNRAALDAVTFKTGILKGPQETNLETHFLGETWGLPVGVAPVGMSGLIWPGGETTIAKAATAAGVPYCLSTVAATTPEAVGPHTGGRGWFQLYPPGDADIRRDMLARAWDAGFRTLVLTADVAVASRRERLRRAGISNPMRMTPRVIVDAALHPAWALATLKSGIPRLETLEKYAEVDSARPGTAHIGYQLRCVPDQEYLKALRDEWQGNLVVKGVMTPEDAAPLSHLGVDAIWVSNHGGRQFDGAGAGLEALEKIRADLPDAKLIYDGGIASGTDILRAIALGADFTFVGRAPHYGLGAFGATGVAHIFDIFKASIEADLGQMALSRPVEVRKRLNR